MIAAPNLLEIDRPFDNWCVLGRTGGDFAEIRFADLGLDPNWEYLVFEFWSKKLLGIFQGGFIPGAIDPKFRGQAFCIRERQARPQLIATSRHLTAGGVALVNLQWDSQRLAGESKLVARDPYTLYLSEPPGFRFEKFDGSTLTPEKIEREGALLKITLRSETSDAISWAATFSLISPE